MRYASPKYGPAGFQFFFQPLFVIVVHQAQHDGIDDSEECKRRRFGRLAVYGLRIDPILEFSFEYALNFGFDVDDFLSDRIGQMS